MKKELIKTWHDAVLIWKVPNTPKAIEAWKFVHGLVLTAVIGLESIFILPLVIQLVRAFK